MSLIRVGLAVIAMCGALAASEAGWHYRLDSPQTKKHVVEIDAKSMEMTKDPQVFRLQNMAARIYGRDGVNFQEVKSQDALFDAKLGTLSYGPGLSKVIKLKNIYP